MPPALQEFIRARLRRGELPSEAPSGVIAGPASNAVCDACDLPMSGVEYAFEIGERKLWMHIRCFALWISEITKPA
jgi:hypothetical protein